MSDRELLEAAARAAGIEFSWVDQFGVMRAEDYGVDNGKRWNPLTDDGDALRLAVKLEMEVTIDWRNAWADLGARDVLITEPVGADPYAATRRAIVRAAAALGADK